MGHDANGLRILGPEESRSLLAPGGLGRVAITHRALPLILPVSFGLLDCDLVFEVSDGPLLRAARRQDVVCFETDAADAATGTAWSVVVTGLLTTVESPAKICRAAQIGLNRWLSAGGQYLLLATDMISGRHTSGRVPVA